MTVILQLYLSKLNDADDDDDDIKEKRKLKQSIFMFFGLVTAM